MLLFREFGGQLLARTAGAGAGGIAALGHEALDHPVEDQTVIEALANQLLDALHMLGRQIGAQSQ